MVKNIRPLRSDITNVEWMNAVRNEAGYDYQQRIPETTQANIQANITKLFAYTPLMNQFIDTLVNRIGLVIFNNTQWSNPLAQFKRGVLEYGETIEEIMTGLLEATSYDPDRDELEREIFGAMKPEVAVSYHTVNRRDRYKLTIKEPLLRNAFLTSDGLGTFVTNLMGMPQTSDQWDEYLLMANLFKEMDKADAFFNVNVPDVSDQDSDSADSRFLLRRLREFSNTLPFISRMYNPAGMPVAANPDELILITTAKADAATDVEALAAAFNITKAEFGSRKLVLPGDHLGIPGVQSILTTDKFFVVADQRIDTTSVQNPAGLFNNYWLHHWQLISASRFAPLIMFNSERPSTEISVAETPVTSITGFTIKDAAGVTQATNLKRGELFDVAVEGITTPAGGVNGAVRLEIVGAQSHFTRITNNGSGYVGPDESAQTLTINAYAVDTDVPQLKATTSRIVTGTLVRPWPNPEVIEDVDNDGTEEVTPDAPMFKTPDKIEIPNGGDRVEYRDGGTPVTGTVTITGAAGTTKTITAVAKTGWELTAGATASWVFTKV